MIDPETTPQSSCPICGSALDPSLAAGGCPACLWGDLIAGESEERGVIPDAPEIEGYQILGELGRGGMGLVYRAQQEKPSRTVALKIVAPYSLRGAQERLRFLVETEAMAAVTHPALLPLYEAGEDEWGRPWFTMQLAEGGTLAQRIAAYSRDWRGCAGLLVRLCGAVQYAHERGILHRDLKPANVLFDGRGDAFVADFGLAKWVESEADFTHSTDLLGSPVYLAPEMAAGGARAATTVSDVYGLGAILYQLLTGRTPYDAASAGQVLTQILTQPPPAPRQREKDIPRDLEVITLKAIARDPARRYASAAALADDLQRWLDGRPITARPVGPTERAWHWVRRNPVPASLTFLLLASLSAGGILLWRANQRLTASLNDAEERVEFMTRELPVSLAPLGRLDLLDGVFQNVAGHYAAAAGESPESLAREADFLTQWAQILRPRGLNAEATARLRQAVTKAHAATAAESAPAAAVRARITAAWRLGEALIEGKQYDEAEAVLREAAAYTASQPAKDLSLRVLDAQITLEMAWLALGRRDLPLTVSLGEAAWGKWQAMLPELEAVPLAAARQITLVEVLKTRQLLAHAAQQQKDTPAARRHLTELQAMAGRLIALAPENAHFHSALLRSHLTAAAEDGAGRDAVLTSFTAAEKLAAALLAKDSTNLLWLTDAVECAGHLATLARQDGNTSEHRHWRSIMSERLGRLYQSNSTDLRFLTDRANYARECARHHLPDDWPTARLHYLGQLEARRRAADLNGSGSGMEWETSQMAKLIEKYEGRDAAEKWRAEYRKTL